MGTWAGATNMVAIVTVTGAFVIYLKSFSNHSHLYRIPPAGVGGGAQYCPLQLQRKICLSNSLDFYCLLDRQSSRLAVGYADTHILSSIWPMQ